MSARSAVYTGALSAGPREEKAIPRDASTPIDLAHYYDDGPVRVAFGSRFDAHTLPGWRRWPYVVWHRWLGFPPTRMPDIRCVYDDDEFEVAVGACQSPTDWILVVPKGRPLPTDWMKSYGYCQPKDPAFKEQLEALRARFGGRGAAGANGPTQARAVVEGLREAVERASELARPRD